MYVLPSGGTSKVTVLEFEGWTVGKSVHESHCDGKTIKKVTSLGL